MLLTPISTYMQNIIWIILVHNLFLAANVCKYTVRYAVILPYNMFLSCRFLGNNIAIIMTFKFT